MTRLASLLACAAVLVGCDRSDPPAEPAADVLAVPAPPPRIPDPDPAQNPRPLDVLPAQSEQSRAEADAALRELDQRAANLQADIAGARQQADTAVRQARPPEPAPPPPIPQAEPAETSPTAPAPATPVPQG